MKSTILVVDDDSSVREALKEILEESGYDVILAEDGDQGAAHLNQSRFNLMFLDLDLPKRSGFDLLDLISTIKPSPAVIVLTGVFRECEPGALAGVDAIFEKPPDVPLVLSTVSSLLREPYKVRLERRKVLATATVMGTSAVGSSLALSEQAGVAAAEEESGL